MIRLAPKYPGQARTLKPKACRLVCDSQSDLEGQSLSDEHRALAVDYSLAILWENNARLLLRITYEILLLV